MRYIGRRRATRTKTLALKIGQVKKVVSSTRRLLLGSHIDRNLLLEEDSPMERIKKREQRSPLHSIIFSRNSESNNQNLHRSS